MINRFFRQKTKRNTGKLQVKLNISPSAFDARDEVYALPPFVSTFNSQDVIITSLKKYCSPIKNQGRIGSCGSHAFTNAMEILMNIKKEKSSIPLSELFHYYIVRSAEYENTFPSDSGQTLRMGAKVCSQIGISPEKLCPYDYNKMNDKPGVFAYGFSSLFKINEYNRCYTVQSMKLSLLDKKPVVIGIYVNAKNIFNTDKTGDLEDTGVDDGGHALCIVGVDDTHKNLDKTVGAFEFANSWGTGWGNKGFGWIGYDHLRKKMIEAWSVK